MSVHRKRNDSHLQQLWEFSRQRLVKSCSCLGQVDASLLSFLLKHPQHQTLNHTQTGGPLLNRLTSRCVSRLTQLRINPTFKHRPISYSYMFTCWRHHSLFSPAGECERQKMTCRRLSAPPSEQLFVQEASSPTGHVSSYIKLLITNEDI